MMFVVVVAVALANWLPAYPQGADKDGAQTPSAKSKRYPARHFNSAAPFLVEVNVDKIWAERAPNGLWLTTEGTMRAVGRTPLNRPLEIPACEAWWVAPLGTPIADVVREVKAQGIPGLLFRTATDDDLAQLQSLTGLQVLIFDRTSAITDAGLEHLEGLTGLQVLVLLDTKVTDAGLEHLQGPDGVADAEPVSRESNWRRTGAPQGHDGAANAGSVFQSAIADAGLEHLEGLTGLQSLYLARTKVTDAGLERLKSLTGLQSLCLARTQVTDAGLEHLKGLTNFADAGFVGLGCDGCGAGAPQSPYGPADAEPVWYEGDGRGTGAPQGPDKPCSACTWVRKSQTRDWSISRA